METWGPAQRSRDKIAMKVASHHDPAEMDGGHPLKGDTVLTWVIGEQEVGFIV